jgi:hypothetical protein
MKLGELRQSLKGARDPQQLNAARPLRAKVSTDGGDALLLSGQHSGSTLSQVAAKDPQYVRQLSMSNAPDDLREVARYLLTLREDA